MRDPGLRWVGVRDRDGDRDAIPAGTSSRDEVIRLSGHHDAQARSTNSAVHHKRSGAAIPGGDVDGELEVK